MSIKSSQARKDELIRGLFLKIKESFDIGTFIETGTYRAKTSLWAIQHFSNVYSIEASKDLFTDVVSKHSTSGVNFIYGDSSVELRKIVEGLTEPFLVWLDAHWSGEITYGEEKECPVIDEIRAIVGSELDCVILIDDIDYFLCPPPRPHKAHHWPDISILLKEINLGQGQFHTIIFDNMLLAIPKEKWPEIEVYFQDLSTDRYYQKNANEVQVNQDPKSRFNLRRPIKEIMGALKLSPKGRSHNTYRTVFDQFVQSSDPKRGFKIQWEDRRIIEGEDIENTNFDRHYVYHTAWAARILKKANPSRHIDISSFLYFSTIASAFIPIEFYDYRPADVELTGLETKRGDLLSLPFKDNSVTSLSSMHVVEHVGLGRYGDPIDPQADLKAISELTRCLSPGGNLLFVVPVGEPKVVFNAHRIYSYEQITDAFSNLTLKEFSLISNEGNGGIIINAKPELVGQENYACGCFWFTKEFV